MDQWGIRNCFEVGQSVLVRFGTKWLTRTIEKITVYRGSDSISVKCPNCDMPVLGEPRFWFKDYGNIPISEVMAREDIDPEPDKPTLVSPVKAVK